LPSGSGGSSADRACHFVKLARELKITQDTHESLAIDAANYLCSQIQHLLGPISSAVNQGGPWEERSAMVRLAQKLQKSKRNKRWRKRKRQHVAELFQKVLTSFTCFFCLYLREKCSVSIEEVTDPINLCHPLFPDVVQESADFDRIDLEADEWRARQIANDIAKRKVLVSFD
jgi:hypothetical protein